MLRRQFLQRYDAGALAQALPQVLAATAGAAEANAIRNRPKLPIFP